ncbi:linear amide C-N hydrolase [Halodesulfovibrio marinisediminis]|nr:linear amide C-N hydrolase [Halodesulfovibrio marinisediminis]
MRKKNKYLILTELYLSLAVIMQSNDSEACSRIVVATPHHGVIVSRTLDWSKELGEIAEVSGVGQKRTTRNKSGHYANPATWTVKYQTLSFIEPKVFECTTSEAINEKGLSASVLYMADSEKIQQTHSDNEAPAVNLQNLVSYLVENNASVQEALDAKEAGKWQVAWAETIHIKGEAIQGPHFSMQDKSGHIALFQFTDVGEVIYDSKKGDDDLNVMTNAPLLWKQRVMLEYVGKNNIRRMDADIHPYSRFQRLTAYLNAQQFDSKLSRAQVDAKISLVMDTGGSVPTDVKDESTGLSYETQVKIQYHFDTGDISFKNYQVDEQMRFNFKDIMKFKKPMFADLMGDLAAGHKSPNWLPYNPAKCQ